LAGINVAPTLDDYGRLPLPNDRILEEFLFIISDEGVEN
jgi:hypothetical protein